MTGNKPSTAAQRQLDALDRSRDAVAGRLLLPWSWHFAAAAIVGIIWAAHYLPEWWDSLTTLTGFALVIWLGRASERIRGLRLTRPPVTRRGLVWRGALVVLIIGGSAAGAYVERRFDLQWLHAAVGAVAVVSTVVGGRCWDRRDVRRLRSGE